MMRVVMAALMLSACGGQPKIVQYATERHERLMPVAVHIPVEERRPFRGRDTMDMVDNDVLAQAAAKKKPDGREIVAAGNADALTDPTLCEMAGNTLICDYMPESTYEIYACGARNIVMQFAPGERMTREPLMGNRSGWSHVRAQTGDGHGHIVDVLLFRPKSDEMSQQYAQVFTNVGPYHLKLNVLRENEKACMMAVKWNHPQRDLLRLMAAADKPDDERESAPAPARMSLQYEIEVLDGSPRWTPVSVARITRGDRAEVVIQFPSNVAWSKVPGFKCDNGLCDYRYVPEDKTIIVPGTFSRAVLSLGSKEQGYERVLIRALKEAR